MSLAKLFRTGQSNQRILGWGDVVVLLGIIAILYTGVRLALSAPDVVQGPDISLAFGALPWYAALSLGRMAAAYALSLLFTVVYGYVAAYNRRAEQVLMPLLDVLQSVPILSFLPVVLLSFSAVLPDMLAAELAAIVLIFTSQVWNITFAWYQSLTTIGRDLHEASAIFRLNRWQRLKWLELPFAAGSLIWNSMMSWAGGWFFLMAAEIFTVGERDFRLPGLGAYLQEAANQGDVRALTWGIVTLILVVVLLDQILWRPLLAWAERFKIEMVEDEEPATSWFYDLLVDAKLLARLARGWQGWNERLDRWLAASLPPVEMEEAGDQRPHVGVYIVGGLIVVGLLYVAYQAGLLLIAVPVQQWAVIGVGLFATLVRVNIALAIALLWTVPLGVAIGTNRRLARWLQPVVQITASVPATALFPAFLLLFLHLPGGLNLASVVLMLAGTQWYLLFNVIAGASAIPQDLKYTASLLHLDRRTRWRMLILPALFPYIVTGAITASGGAWNASIVAEHVQFGGRTLVVTGIGAVIANATAAGDYPLLLAATLGMILAVVAINRLLWRRLYRLAEERFRME
ncbi:MAG: ABC transporter permease subunit [Caldilineaceae bacterium]|nr:ABC transporter permease subunit [Caldilineaceae bacterium]